MADLKWYVVRAVSGQEKKAKQYLETEIARHKFEEWVPQILIPAEKVFEMRNGKKRVRERSFFPGYILIEADLTHGELEHTILSIPGVIGFLDHEQSTVKETVATDRNGKRKTTKVTEKKRVPLPLRPAEVNRILGKLDESEAEDASLAVPFVLGERVKVMDGPFKTFSGTVREIFDERKRLNVVVSIFGRETPVELNYTQVEKDTEVDAGKSAAKK